MEADLEQKRFVWGAVLAWAPWVPMMIVLGSMFRGISNSKATGLAAVAGGMTELLVVWGILSMIASQVAAIVWLCRSLSRGHLTRGLIAAVSICASGVVLFIVGAFLLWGRNLYR